MMYLISKEIEFDAGHRVPLHASKCRNPHGHRYRVVALIQGELITEGSESGMVRDFGIVKELLMEHVHDKYDHGFIVHINDIPMLHALGSIDTYGEPDWKIIVVPFIPTAECLAKSIYDDLKLLLPNLVEIVVWETPTSCASYNEDVRHNE
jgi:6-pyruvoyltetrahydropterin/6-carboxytetrahydropterin synthase